MMQTDNLLLLLQGLNTPRAQPFAQIDLSTVCAIRSEKPYAADLCHSFRAIPLLYFDCVNVFSHLHILHHHFIIQISVILCRSVSIRVKVLALERKLDKIEGIFFLVNWILNIFKLDRQGLYAPELSPVFFSLWPLAHDLFIFSNYWKFANILHFKSVNCPIVSTQTFFKKVMFKDMLLQIFLFDFYEPFDSILGGLFLL